MACRKVNPHNIGRYALAGCVEERLWMGQPTDVDIDFVRRHDNDIVATLNAAIVKHMYVSL